MLSHSNGAAAARWKAVQTRAVAGGKKTPEKLYVRTSPYLHNLPKANEAAQGVRVIVISVWERQKDH